MKLNRSFARSFILTDKQQIIGSNNLTCKLNYFVMKVIEENIFDYTFFASFQFRTKYLLIAVKEYKKKYINLLVSNFTSFVKSLLYKIEYPEMFSAFKH